MSARPESNVKAAGPSGAASGLAPQVGEGLSYLTVTALGQTFQLWVGDGGQTFRWLVLAAIHRAAALKRQHGRQRQRESSRDAPSLPPAVAVHGGRRALLNGRCADTEGPFFCNPPPQVLATGWRVWVETDGDAERQVNRFYGADSALGVVVNRDQGTLLLHGWGLPSWPFARRSAEYTKALSAWYFAAFQNPILPELGSMEITVAIEPDPITREARTAAKPFRTWVRSGWGRAEAIEARLQDAWDHTAIAEVFGRDQQDVVNRVREMVAVRFPAIERAFAKMQGLRDGAPRGTVHVDDMTQLMVEARVVGTVIHVSDVASEMHLANRTRVRQAPDVQRLVLAKQLPEFLETLVRAAAKKTHKDTRRVGEVFEARWLGDFGAAIDRMGGIDCGLRAALFREDGPCRWVVDALAPPLAPAFVRFAPRPGDDKNFIRSAPCWDFDTFVGFVRDAGLGELGVPVAEDSLLLRSAYGHSLQGPFDAQGAILPDAQLTSGHMRYADLVEALCRLAAMCLRGRAETLEDAVQTVLQAAAAAQPSREPKAL